MADSIAQKSSLEVAIERAKRFGASEDEAKRIHNVVSANTTSDIRSFEVTFDHDADDRLAVWSWGGEADITCIANGYLLREFRP